MNKKNNSGFTLIEIIIVIAILGFLSTIAVFDFFAFKENSDLNNNVQEFVSVLKLAQNKAISAENNSQYGVYIDTSDSPNQYVLFKGPSYALRIASDDRTYSLQNTMEFYDTNLGGGYEIVFTKTTGAPEEFGSISIRVKASPNNNKTIYLTNSGTVSFNPPVTSLDENRIKDSRHLHFFYSRSIDTAVENIVLTFDGNQTTIIPISSNLDGGELRWKETVDVGGSNQVVEIRTHKLNDPDTLFSIHRDGRYNNKSLEVTISGDSSGYLAKYSADGSMSDYSSIYVSDFRLQ